jgi:hypothetical protein
MGRIFVSAGYSSNRDGDDLSLNLHAGLEAQEVLSVRDAVLQQLRSHQYEGVAVPPEFTLSQTLDWINRRARPGDVALELRANATDRTQSGTAAFYIAYNYERKTQAEQVLQAYLRRVPQLVSRGAKSDLQSPLGQLAVCRQIRVPSLQLTIGSLLDTDDRRLLQSQRQDVALGIAEGLAIWSRSVSAPFPGATSSGTTEPPPETHVTILVNGATHDDRGVMVNGNVYVPIDLVDQLDLDLPLTGAIRRINHYGVVLVRAIDLREFNLSVNVYEEDNTPIIALRSALPIAVKQMEQIMGQGHTSEIQMMMFLKSQGTDGFGRFPELPKLYREEASIEGVNYDIAFAQMCIETNFLGFGEAVKPEHNNFARLGDNHNGGEAIFASSRVGVRAHIQHLKAYASSAPLVQAIVDPRFGCVRRGIAPHISQLSGRWSADLQYHHKILAALKRLYESAGFF